MLSRRGVGAHLQVLLHGQTTENPPAFRYLGQAQPDDFVCFHFADQLTAIGDFTAAQFQQAGNRVHRCGFAGAVCADQA